MVLDILSLVILCRKILLTFINFIITVVALGVFLLTFFYWT